MSQPHTVETHGLAAQIINAVQCAAAGGDSVGELVNGKETQTKIWGKKKDSSPATKLPKRKSVTMGR